MSVRLAGRNVCPTLLRLVVCSLIAVACLGGCSRSGGPAEISGTVSYDGQPLKKGVITFVPANGSGPTAATTIVDGKYSLKVSPGEKLIRIEGYKVVGQRHYSPNNPNSPMVDMQEQFLPDRYNKKSELARKITPSLRTCDFVLEESPVARP
jgi:hypothetical protein